MLQIPGLGPKKIRALRDKLSIVDIAGLTAACNDGRVAELDGFGAKTQEKILAGIRNREAYGRRHLWWDASAIAEPIVQGLRALPQVGGRRPRAVCAVGWRPSATSFSSRPRTWRRWSSVRRCRGVKEVTASDTKASAFRIGLRPFHRAKEQFVLPAPFHRLGSQRADGSTCARLEPDDGAWCRRRKGRPRRKQRGRNRKPEPPEGRGADGS
jgi:hypothetical protein